MITLLSLSYVEQRLVMARLVWNFDFVNTDNANEWDAEGDFKNMKAFSTWQKPGLRVRALDRGMPGSRYWRRKHAGEQGKFQN